MSPILSIIIPFGLSKERAYIQDRVMQKATRLKSDEKIEYIFVEGYSSLENNLKQIIEENGHIYLKDESQKDFFSQGKCRNLGACFANAQVIMFLDVDCYVSPFSLEKILNLIKIKNITINYNIIFVLPVIYLTEYGSSFVYNQDEDIWDALIQNDLISGKNSLINFFAPSSTSSIIINKHKFLALGGNNEKFIGHGYEDFDFFARVLHSCVVFEKMPINLYYDFRNWNFINFEGFRSWFSLLGYEMSFYGIYMYHFWHVEPNQNGYMSNKNINHKQFYANLKKINSYSINPLQVIGAKENNILLICNEEVDLNFFRDISVYIGIIIKFNNQNFLNEEYLLEYINKNKINYFLICSSLEDIQKSKIQIFAKKYLIKCIYFGKGVLPNSWFFDESESLDISINRNLDNKDILNCKQYFNSLTNQQRNSILNLMLKYNFSEQELIPFIYFLKYNYYSFFDTEKKEFYQIVISRKKIFIGAQDNNFYSLNSFIYKPYIFELNNNYLKKILFKLLGFYHLKSILSHTKFYRLMQKKIFDLRKSRYRL
ncbi:galactosyltransferase-related protein [Campylobacter sp. 2457A]|uniref:galactosyltransferase-related protein n=1 Tax=Campylobacter sp. 2457A TaxID=2735784 RepID=UPI00301C04B3|nr:glycosyltransferase [Campylobacter sp. 2457A]